MTDEDESSDEEAATSSDELPPSEDPASGDRQRDEPRASRRSPPTAWLIAAGVTLVSGAGVFQVFRPDNAGRIKMMIALLGTIYGILAALTVWWLHRRDELKSKLAPRRGDVTLGAVVAVGTYLLATGVHILLTSRGSPKEAWLIRIYLQSGDPQVTATFFVGPIIFVVAAFEEIVWRGLVLGKLMERVSPYRALIATTLLYTLAHLPTVYLLRDPYVGLNPLVVMAALGCGLVWGWLAVALDRLSLSIIAHALFTWSIVEFPIMNM